MTYSKANDKKPELGMVFPIFYLMGFIRLNGVLFISKALNFVTEAKILFRRIFDILEMPEIDPKRIIKP